MLDGWMQCFGIWASRLIYRTSSILRTQSKQHHLDDADADDDDDE